MPIPSATLIAQVKSKVAQHLRPERASFEAHITIGMVGVAGKSKGCVTCKKRRIKCDESKPTCKRCEKSRYICGGYAGLQFVNTSTAPFESQQSQSSQPSKYVGKMLVTVIPRMRTAALPPELSLIAFQPSVCLSFLMRNFVWRTFGSGWLEPAAQEQLDPLSTQAVRALSNIFFGIFHHQEDIQMQACLHYGKALKLLRGGLADYRKPGIENLIVPILVLLMHASYEEDQAAAVSHVKGLIMLLQIAGPARFQTDPIRKAFESARATLAIAFLLARQPLFLTQEEWKVTPWALDPFSKSQQNLITDILVDVPNFLAEDDKRQEHDDPSMSADLLERVKTSLFLLYCWRYTWELLSSKAVFETTPAPKEAKSRVISEYLHFRSHEQAAEIQVYNATLLFLLGLIERLSPLDAKSVTIPQQTALLAASASTYALRSSSTSDLLLPHEVTSLRDPAIEIIRAFEFQMEVPDRNRDSNLYFLFPLGIAWEVMKDEDEYRDWMRSILDKTPVTSGYAVGRNRWFGKYYLPKVRVKGKEGAPILRPPGESGRE